MRDYSNTAEDATGLMWFLLRLMMACCYWWLVSQSDTLVTMKDRMIYLALYFLGISPVGG